MNEALRKTHDKTPGLLLILDHPEIPLHNNLGEHDIRQHVTNTRSDADRHWPDTSLVLKTTCRKPGGTI